MFDVSAGRKPDSSQGRKSREKLGAGGSPTPFRREAPILGAVGFQDAHRSLVALPLEQLDVLLAIGARRRRHLSELEAPERRRRLRAAA